jgi:hypothetical protein
VCVDGALHEALQAGDGAGALTAPDLRRPKKELMAAARSDGRAEQRGAGEVFVVRTAQGTYGMRRGLKPL